MHDIATHLGLDKVKAVIGDFYNRVQEHPTLARPFGIVDDWEEHKAHLSHFWWVTLGGRPYRNKPYQVAHKHAMAGFTPELLVDWLSLFRTTLNSHLPPDTAAEWFARAANIGRSLKLLYEARQGIVPQRSHAAASGGVSAILHSPNQSNAAKA
jgi:hemoglobin